MHMRAFSQIQKTPTVLRIDWFYLVMRDTLRAKRVLFLLPSRVSAVAVARGVNLGHVIRREKPHVLGVDPPEMPALPHLRDILLQHLDHLPCARHARLNLETMHD